MFMKGCPTEDNLCRYAVGDLSVGEAQTIEMHLDQCSACLVRLDNLAGNSDSLVSALRRPVELALPDSPALAKAVAAVLASDTHPSALPGSEPVIGTFLGGFKILELLGHGGMGRVYRALHPRLNQEVAIKILRPGFDSQQFIARFEAERQALAMMDHPHIARVFDGGVTDEGQPYFVMELVCGSTMTLYCTDHCLNLVQCLELFIEVCQAVQHAHQRGLIHRDLKPSNVLIAEYDGRPAPKIIDFGIAKAVEGRLAVETEIGMLVGTLEYMSPEQAGLSSRDMDTRSDIYSLGVLLYELLTGETPLERQRIRTLSLVEALRLIREEEPPLPSLTLMREAKAAAGLEINGERSRELADPSERAKRVRGELDWIVLKALDKDRAQRFESASALADDVRRFLNDELVLASPRSSGYRLKKFVRRNQRVMVTVAAFMLLLLASVIVSSWLAVKSREAQAKAEIDRDQAKTAGKQARDSAAEARSVLRFLQERILSVGRPAGQEGGLGRDLTIREAVEAAEPSISESFQGQPLVEATVRNTLGMTYNYVGDPAAAVTQFERAWLLRRDNAGHDHIDTIDSMNELGIAYLQLGQLDQAQSLLEQVKQLRETLLGAEDADTLRSARELAVAYIAAGKLDQASDLATQAFDGLALKLGAEHIETLLSESCLASSDQAAGRLKPAVVHFERVVKGLTNKVGDEHPYTLAALNNLGLAYRADGQLDRAIPLFEKAREIQQSKLGPEHLHTLTSMNNLALVYIDQQQLVKAIPLLLQVLEGRNAKLIPDHPSTLLCMNNLAEAYQRNGQPNLAFPLLERVLEVSKTKLGADHPDTLEAMNNLAALHFFAGRIDQAIALHEETLERRTAKLTTKHLDTLISMNNLAYCYWKAHKIDLSIGLFKQTLAGRSEVLGQDHPQTMAVLITLSGVYRDVGQLDQALSLLEHALADRQTRLGKDHRDTQRLAKKFAVIQIDRGFGYLQQMKFAEAEGQLRPAASFFSRQQPESWENFVAQSLLGGSLLGQMKYAEAEPLLLQGYEGMKQHESTTPANTQALRAQGLERLVQLYDDWGKAEEAAKWRAISLP